MTAAPCRAITARADGTRAYEGPPLFSVAAGWKQHDVRGKRSLMDAGLNAQGF